MNRIGFTGTQRGMTDKQKVAVGEILSAFRGAELHHGDCVGADAEAHGIAETIPMRIVIHPPENESKRAFKRADYYEPRAPYLTRNQAIVYGTDFLIATPGEPTEQLRSGTWSTVRTARRYHKKVFLVLPDGRVV